MKRWAGRVTCSNIGGRQRGLRDLQTLYWIAKYLYKVDEVANVVDRGVLTKEAHRFDRARVSTSANCIFLQGAARIASLSTCSPR